MHHIIADGWSLGVWFANCRPCTMRCVKVAHRPWPSPSCNTPTLPFGNVRGSTMHDSNRIWFIGNSDWPAPRALELPTDHPRPTQPTFAGSIESRVLPADVSGRLQSTSQAEGVTLFMFLLAALDAVLHRYTGQDDLVVGAPIAGRDRQQLENLVGFFTNTLVLRADLAGDPTFRELLGRVKQTTLDAYTHQLVPFDKLVERIEPGRNRQRSPLFQVALVLENAPLQLDVAGAMQIQPLLVDNGTAKYDLTIYCWPRPDGIELVAEYSTEFFERATIVRLPGRAGNAADRGGLASHVAALGVAPGKRRRPATITVELERYPAAVPRESNLERIARRASRPHAPGRRSVRCQWHAHVCRTRPPRQSTGALPAELGCRSEYAGRVVRPAFEPHACRAVRHSQGRRRLCAARPGLPVQRLAHMLDDAQVRVLVTAAACSINCRRTRPKKFCWMVIGKQFRWSRAIPPPPTARPTDLAYTIYTSGSTGKPKGVEITHRALVNFLWSFRDEPGWRQTTCWWLLRPCRSTSRHWRCFCRWWLGRLVIAPRETAVDGQALAALLDESKATVMQATPATWRLLIAAGWRPRSRFKILCGGEALSPALARELAERCDSLWNVYGPTETTIWSTVYEVRAQRTLAGLKPCRSAGRSPTPRFTFWIRIGTSRRLVCRANFILAGRVWPAVIAIGPS